MYLYKEKRPNMNLTFKTHRIVGSDIDIVDIEQDTIFKYRVHIFLKKENNYVPTKKGKMGAYYMTYTDDVAVIHQPF